MLALGARKSLMEKGPYFRDRVQFRNLFYFWGLFIIQGLYFQYFGFIHVKLKIVNSVGMYTS